MKEIEYLVLKLEGADYHHVLLALVDLKSASHTRQLFRQASDMFKMYRPLRMHKPEFIGFRARDVVFISGVTDPSGDRYRIDSLARQATDWLDDALTMSEFAPYKATGLPTEASLLLEKVTPSSCDIVFNRWPNGNMDAYYRANFGDYVTVKTDLFSYSNLSNELDLAEEEGG